MYQNRFGLDAKKIWKKVIKILNCKIFTNDDLAIQPFSSLFLAAKDEK